MKLLWLDEPASGTAAIEGALIESDCMGLIVSALDRETQIYARELALPLVVRVPLPQNDGLDMTNAILALGPEVLRAAAWAYDPRYRARGAVIEIAEVTKAALALLWELGEAFDAWLGRSAREWTFWAACQKVDGARMLKASNIRCAMPGPQSSYAGLLGRPCHLEFPEAAVGELPSRLEVVRYGG